MYLIVAESNITAEGSNTLAATTECLFNEGDKFYSIEELTTKLEQFDMDNYVQFWKRDAKLIESQSNKVDR